MRIKKLSFPGSQEYELGARLDLPEEGEPQAFAIFAHCFTCTKNLKAINNIDQALTAAGIAVLRFDFTGLGESEGDFAETNFSSNVGDLVAAADFLAENYRAPQILIGHSLGGAAVMQAAQEVPSCVAVATIAAPAQLEDLKHLILSRGEEIEARGEARVQIGNQEFRLKKQFIEDLERNNMQRVIARLERPLIVFHSPADRVVDIRNAYAIFETASHPKSFVSLDQAGHLLLDEADSRYVGAMIATWASRYCALR
jgi:alpha-beta hydrolase superfamily lysophospholipase